MSERQMRIGSFLKADGEHIAAWRHPEVVCGGGADFSSFIASAQIAEAAKLDFLFMGDVGANVDLPPDVLRRSSWLDKLEPLSVITALGTVTERIGLVSTATTTFNEPYALARRLATMDHLNAGRTGWNLVTTLNHTDARNYGKSELEDSGQRYARAEEFVDIVKGLWDSWDDGDFVRDKASGEYFRVPEIRYLDHVGKHFEVRGPLDQPRPPQGHPVIVQAGSSNEGRSLAARVADVAFYSEQNLAKGQAFYDDIRARAMTFGRSPDDIRILVGMQPVVASTLAAAQAKFEELQVLLDPSVAVQMLSTLMGGVDLRDYPLDEKLPPLPPAKGLTSRRDMLTALAEKRGFTLRQLALHVAGSRGHPVIIGTPEMVADHMEHWFGAGTADGFLILPSTMPGGIRDFCEHVVPELQRRGLFRREYVGETLREHLGVPRPAFPHAR